MNDWVASASGGAAAGGRTSFEIVATVSTIGLVLGYLLHAFAPTWRPVPAAERTTQTDEPEEAAGAADGHERQATQVRHSCLGYARPPSARALGCGQAHFCEIVGNSSDGMYPLRLGMHSCTAAPWSLGLGMHGCALVCTLALHTPRVGTRHTGANGPGGAGSRLPRSRRRQWRCRAAAHLQLRPPGRCSSRGWLRVPLRSAQRGGSRRAGVPTSDVGVTAAHRRSEPVDGRAAALRRCRRCRL